MSHELRIKNYIIGFLICTFFFSNSTITFAESPYVLPYPSAMPGGFTYKIHLIEEKLLSYWYFGSFGQFDYNLKLSDKYLVEAKTLFEYKQYLLAENALKKSDVYFKNAQVALTTAKRQNKNITELQKTIKEAALKHIELLMKTKQEIPVSFNWTPEKSAATQLPLHADIDLSIKTRNSCL